MPDLAALCRHQAAPRRAADGRRGAFARACSAPPAAASASTSASTRSDVDLWMGTLSQVAGGLRRLHRRQRARWSSTCKYTAPGFVYSVGISPPMAAAALAALRMHAGGARAGARGCRPMRRTFLALARAAGFDTGSSAGAAHRARHRRQFRRRGALAQALFAARASTCSRSCYPAVPERSARLRFFISSRHTGARSPAPWRPWSRRGTGWPRPGWPDACRVRLRSPSMRQPFPGRGVQRLRRSRLNASRSTAACVQR